MRKYSRAATQALQDRRLVLLQGTELSAIASPYLEKGVVKEWDKTGLVLSS